jgi:hypothetical protein
MVFKLFKSLRIGGDDPKVAKKNQRDKEVDYRGFTIIPNPSKSSGGWTTEGDIEREIDSEVHIEHFIRAETHTELEQAVSHTITKAKRIIDEKSDLA